MIAFKHVATTLGLVLAGMAAQADTIWLNSGIPVDGVVTKLPNGMIRVEAGKNTVTYRPSEVREIEENEKTGHFDEASAKARWEERNQELIELTGLTAEQRAKVEALLYELQKEDRNERIRARDQLKALQEKFDAYRYIAYLFPGLSHRLAPWVLEAMYILDPARAVPVIRGEIDDTYYQTRAMAITLSAVLEDRSAVPGILRGLVDHKSEVQTQAVLALAHLQVREATPALIALLSNPDVGVQSNAQRALMVLWGDAFEGDPPNSPEAWQALWDANAAKVARPVELASLEPLIQPENEFQDE